MYATSRTLSKISLIIAIAVVIIEIPWLSRGSLAFFILFFAIAIGLNSLANLKHGD